MEDEPFQHNTFTVPTSIMPVASEYHIARRRAEAATRRGDFEAVHRWLSVAERFMALAERYDRGRMKRDRQVAWQMEQPHRLKALKARADYPR